MQAGVDQLDQLVHSQVTQGRKTAFTILRNDPWLPLWCPVCLIVECAIASCLFISISAAGKWQLSVGQDGKGADSPLCQHPREQGLLANAGPSEQGWPVAPRWAASATQVQLKMLPCHQKLLCVQFSQLNKAA